MKFKDLRNLKLIFRLLTICAVLVISFSFASFAFADGLGETLRVPLEDDIVLDSGSTYSFGMGGPVVFHMPKENSIAVSVDLISSSVPTGSVVTITRDILPGVTVGDGRSYGNSIGVYSQSFPAHVTCISGCSTTSSNLYFDADSFVCKFSIDSYSSDGSFIHLIKIPASYNASVNRQNVTYTLEVSAPNISFGNGVGASTQFDVASTSASTVNVPAGYTAIFYRPSGNIGDFTAKLSASDFYPKPGFSDYVNGVTIFDTMEPLYLQSAYPINQVVWDTKFAGKTGSFTYLTQNSSAPFVQLVNPLFSQNSDLTKPNPTVKVEYPAGFVVKLFSLTYNSDRSSEVLASSSAVNYVPENMIFEDPSTGGQVNNPSTGGNSEDLIYDGGETDNLLQNLSNLFTPGINAVSELVSRATGFFTALGTMFSWLPDEVFTVVISALSILIIVGAIKLFL